MLTKRLFAFCAALAAATATGQTANPITLPVDRLDRYTVSTDAEVVESFAMERVRLRGELDILHDPVPEMQWERERTGVSAAFVHQFNPNLRYEIYSFCQRVWEHQADAATLATYLQQKATEYPEANFEVILAPEKTQGKARFRILGQRAIPLIYAFDRGDQRILRAENWVDYDDWVHIVAIEAPESLFDRFHEMVRQNLNSMVYRD